MRNLSGATMSRKRPWRASGKGLLAVFLIDSRGRRLESFSGKQYRRVLRTLRREAKARKARNG